MAYSDIERKLHGKVKIIYVDMEKIDETIISTSGNGAVSKPEEVRLGYSTPSVKACTMDGHSKMDGSFKMVDNSLIVGWWSNVLSNADGTFTTNPYIQMTFIPRPMWEWIVVGDNKLNQYPVDFNLILYGADNTVLRTVEYRDNTNVNAILKIEPTVTGVAKVRMEIIKWSKGNAKVKIIQFFDLVEEEYGGSDLRQFEVVEEIASSKDGIYFGLCSNTMTAVIYNKDRKFDQGYLKDLLVLDRKVKPYIGIENSNGETTYEPLGTYYSDSWSIPQSDQFVKVKCYDRLMKFQKMTYLGFPFKKNANLKEMFQHVIESAGLTSSEYVIANELAQIPVPYAILGKQSVWDALQTLCNAGLARVYFDRTSKLHVTLEAIPQTISESITPNRLFTFSKVSQRNNFCNKVEVDYTDVVLSETETEDVYSNKISIDKNSRITLTVDYSKEVTDAYLSYLPLQGINLVSFESSVNAGKFILENTTNNNIIATVTITGKVLNMSQQTVSVENRTSIVNYGEMVYKHSGCELIQTYARAVAIGEILLSALGENNSELTINWRGNPAIKLENKIECTDKYNNKSEYTIHYNRFVFDGGLKQDTKAKEVKQ